MPIFLTQKMIKTRNSTLNGILREEPSFISSYRANAVTKGKVNVWKVCSKVQTVSPQSLVKKCLFVQNLDECETYILIASRM